MHSVSDYSGVVPVTIRGRRFRSLTEARWATLLDALGVAYEYEPETYDLGPLGWYLPDFWIPKLGERGAFLEVKRSGPLSDRDYDRAKALYLLASQPVLVAQGFGEPPWGSLLAPNRWPGELYDMFDHRTDLPQAGAGGNGHHLTACVCGSIAVMFGGYGSKDGCAVAGDHGWDVPRLQRAYETAVGFRPGRL